MPESLGSVTLTIFEHLESHKLHLEFEADGAINAGSPVKLSADGTVAEAADSDDENLVIGVSIHTAADTERFTVAMRAYAVVVNAEAEAVSLNAGPVELGPWNGTTSRREYLAASTVPKTIGWNLTQATADGELITVALKG
jgi:hypothetical protein